MTSVEVPFIHIKRDLLLTQRSEAQQASTNRYWDGAQRFVGLNKVRAYSLVWFDKTTSPGRES